MDEERMPISVEIADYQDERDAEIIGELMNQYAQDEAGGATPISEDIRRRIAPELAKFAGAFTVIAYLDNRPAGLTNCLPGFSTFKCKPLINIHDLVVAREFRGLGISLKMLNRVEEVAKERGCCKLTLEVLAANQIAKNAYLKFGFKGYELDPKMGKAEFWEKALEADF